MKNKTLIWIIGFLVLVGVATAVPLNPEVYWGFVYIEGEFAPDGSVLSVETVDGELLVNQTLPEDPGYPGSYYVEIPFDNPHTSQDEGADDGEQITWKLDGVVTLDPAAGEDTAETGMTNNNFTITAVTNPNVTANVNYSNQSIVIGDWINLTVFLNNSGDGTADVTVLNVTGNNLITDLPKYLQVAKNNVSQTWVNITPSACGEFNPDLIINYYDLAGALVDTLTENLSFNVNGSDVEIVEVTASRYSITTGTEITIGAILSNIGNYEIDGFNITFYDGYPNGTVLNSVDTNLTLAPGENTSVTFNWKPGAGSHKVTAVVTISENECDESDNIMDSSKITVNAGSGGGGGGSSSGRSRLPVNITINETEENVTEELVEENVTAEENKTVSSITGMIIKETKDHRKILPFILIIILMAGILAFYYWFKKEEIEIKQKKLPIEVKKEAKNKIEEKPKVEKLRLEKPLGETKKPEIKPAKPLKEERPRLNIFNNLLKSKPAKETQEKPIPLIKEEKKIDEKIKIRPRSAVFDKPMGVDNKMSEKPAEFKPKIKVNRDAAIVNMATRIKEIVGRKQKKLPVVAAVPKTSETEQQLVNVPYEHLAQAIELIEKISADKQPRDVLVQRYVGQYPRYLIDMVGKYVFLNTGFGDEIDVMDELDKLEILNQDYKEISREKLEKAIDIIAKGYALKK